MIILIQGSGYQSFGPVSFAMAFFAPADNKSLEVKAIKSNKNTFIYEFETFCNPFGTCAQELLDVVDAVRVQLADERVRLAIFKV